MAEIFFLDNNDYSANVVANNYNINLEDVVQEWTDGGQVLHRDVVRQRIQGTFTMFFKEAEDLAEFLDRLKAVKTLRGTYPIKIKVNNDSITEMQSINAFVDLKPTRHRDLKWRDAYDPFEVTIQEP